MSQADLSSDRPRGVLVHKPKTSIYMVLLGVALGAVSVGCLILLIQIWQYGAIWSLPWNVPVDLRQFTGR